MYRVVSVGLAFVGVVGFGYKSNIKEFCLELNNQKNYSDIPS